MVELIISREFLLASYYEALEWLSHEEACKQVADATGQTVETVAEVVEAEATA